MYLYVNRFRKIRVNEIDKQFDRSLLNYKNILKKFPIKTSWDIEFFIYKNLMVNKIGNIIKNKSKMLKTYKLSNFKTKR